MDRKSVRAIAIVVRLKSVSMQSAVLEKLINAIQIRIDQTILALEISNAFSNARAAYGESTGWARAHPEHPIHWLRSEILEINKEIRGRSGKVFSGNFRGNKALSKDFL